MTEGAAPLRRRDDPARPSNVVDGRSSWEWRRLRDRGEVIGAALRGVDAVVHLAAILPPHVDEAPALARRVNVEGTRNVLEAARTFGRAAAEAARAIALTYPITVLFTWSFSEEGRRLAEAVAKDLELPLRERTDEGEPPQRRKRRSSGG